MHKKLLIVLIISSICFTTAVWAKDAIIFRQWEPPRLIAINPDGSDFKVIQENVSAYTVSPDHNTLLVFNTDCNENDTCTITLYDLNKSTKKKVVQPHANWRLGKWISKEKFFVYRKVRQDNGGKACGPSDELEGCAASAILQTAMFNIQSLSFSIEKDFGVGDYDALHEDFPLRFDHDNTAQSPNGRYYLLWKGPDYWQRCLVMQEKDSNLERKIFQRKPVDFGEAYSFTGSPWSPDSRSFVMDYYPGGFFYTIFSGKTKIIVMERKTLQKHIIGQGIEPYWFADFPSSFSTSP